MKCNQCGKEKDLCEFYSQRKIDKKTNEEYLYYNPKCKECCRINAIQWAKDNPERAKELSDKKNRFPTERKKMQWKVHSNEQRKNGYYREWQQSNKDKMNTHGHKYRSKKKNLKNDLSVDGWEFILEIFNYKCAYCGINNDEAKELYGQTLHQEHIVPITKDGEYVLGNIIPACKSCNCSKHNAGLEEWYFRQEFYDAEKHKKINDYMDFYRDDNEEKRAV